MVSLEDTMILHTHTHPFPFFRNTGFIMLWQRKKNPCPESFHTDGTAWGWRWEKIVLVRLLITVTVA